MKGDLINMTRARKKGKKSEFPTGIEPMTFRTYGVDSVPRSCHADWSIHLSHFIAELKIHHLYSLITIFCNVFTGFRYNARVVWHSQRSSFAFLRAASPGFSLVNTGKYNVLIIHVVTLLLGFWTRVFCHVRLQFSEQRSNALRKRNSSRRFRLT